VLSYQTVAQQGNVWVFGDSAMLDINQPGVPLRSSSRSTHNTACISDSLGSLIFYGISSTIISMGSGGRVYNSQHSIMNNGDGILNYAGWHSNLILKQPTADSIFYLFTYSGVITSNPSGVYYSIINPYKNVVGEVVQKNTLLQNIYAPGDILSAVKHGNGRDWWIFWRVYDAYGLDTSLINVQRNNRYYKTLLTPQGLDPISYQDIGSLSYVGGFGDLTFSKDGTKAVCCCVTGLVELFDFDRCTGLFSNPVLIRQDTTYNYKALISCELSPNGRFLYLCERAQISKLYQYDLQSSSIVASKQVLDTLVISNVVGAAERWVDDKIYVSNGDYSSQNAPYPNSMYTLFNSNLSVINFPDLPYPQCNYVRNGFYLNGARTYPSLPNNPNYDLGVSVGSPCDTLSVGIAENNSEQNEIKISPNPVSFNLMLSYKLTQSKQAVVYIYDLLGKLVFSQQIYSSGSQLLIHTENFQKGMYVISVEDNGKRMNKKFIKE
jgi:hypothetical protein